MVRAPVEHELHDDNDDAVGACGRRADARAPVIGALRSTMERPMAKQPESVADFLSGRRIGVAGVSREPAQAANAIFRKLKGCGYDVFPINPRAKEVEGVTCYRDVGD